MIGAVAASLARRRLMDQRQRQRTRQRQHQQQRQRQRQRQRARQESRRRFEQQEQETTDHHMIQHSSTVRQQIRHVCSEVARNDDIERSDAQFVAHVARLEADFFQMLIAEDVNESEEGGEENNGGDDYHQSSELPNEISVDGPSWRIRHDPDFDIPVAAVVPTASVVECSSRGTTNKSMQDRLQAIEETQMAERVNGTILIRAKKSRMCSIQ
tara:strand:- start:257 stop:895 length:639 start_codon:yes stop_codon:yes gene_type:complete